MYCRKEWLAEALLLGYQKLCFVRFQPRTLSSILCVASVKYDPLPYEYKTKGFSHPSMPYFRIRQAPYSLAVI